MINKILVFSIDLFIFIFGPVLALIIIDNLKVVLNIAIRIIMLLIFGFYIFFKFKKQIYSNNEFKVVFLILLVFCWYKIYLYCKKQYDTVY